MVTIIKSVCVACSRGAWWIRHSVENAYRGSTGMIVAVVLGFIAIIIIYQLVPELVTNNDTIQTMTTTPHSITLFASNLGEWLLPLSGILAIGFLIFKKVRG